ncbi:MAG: DNA translocase FtsK [Pseudomonadota bacterium]
MSFDTHVSPPNRLLPVALEHRLLDLARRLAGLFVLCFVAFAWLAIFTWSPLDPSLSSTTNNPVANAMGLPGAVVSDVLLQSLGIACAVALIVPILWGIELLRGRSLPTPGTKIVYYPVSVLCLAGAFSALPTPVADMASGQAVGGWPLHHGFGGIFGDLLNRIAINAAALVVDGNAAWVAGLTLLIVGVVTATVSMGLAFRDFALAFGRHNDVVDASIDRQTPSADPHGDVQSTGPLASDLGHGFGPERDYTPEPWLEPAPRSSAAADWGSDAHGIALDDVGLGGVDLSASALGSERKSGPVVQPSMDVEKPKLRQAEEPGPRLMARGPTLDQRADPKVQRRRPGGPGAEGPGTDRKSHDRVAAAPQQMRFDAADVGAAMPHASTPMTDYRSTEHRQGLDVSKASLPDAGEFAPPPQAPAVGDTDDQSEAAGNEAGSGLLKQSLTARIDRLRSSIAKHGKPVFGAFRPQDFYRPSEPAEPQVVPQAAPQASEIARHTDAVGAAVGSDQDIPRFLRRGRKGMANPVGNGGPSGIVQRPPGKGGRAEQVAHPADRLERSEAVAGNRLSQGSVPQSSVGNCSTTQPTGDVGSAAGSDPSAAAIVRAAPMAGVQCFSVPPNSSVGANPSPHSGTLAMSAGQQSSVHGAPPPSGPLLASKPKHRRGYVRPSLNLLAQAPGGRRKRVHNDPNLKSNGALLKEVLNDFGVKGDVRGVQPGPVVTRYEFEPARGTKTSRVVGLADDIARSMSAVSARVGVIPGRNLIGIELPNAQRETVLLRDLLESKAFKASDGGLPVVLGKGIDGAAVVDDLSRLPHLLMAGTTGSGKSVGVNAIVLSLLYRFSPEDCRFLMIDPKMLELSVYNGIPHLLAPVVTDPAHAVNVLQWVVMEMEDRNRRMAQMSVRNIDVFNNRVRHARKRGETIARMVQTGFDKRTGQALYQRNVIALETMPRIVVVIDEFADLMMVAGKEIEGLVQRLAQMARAAGIHLIMATQRPSVDVITGTIKANFPSRLSYRVASKIDSRTILGEQGAEQLLGFGDLLYSSAGAGLQRLHGPFVSDEEVEAVANALRAAGPPDYVDITVPEAVPHKKPGAEAARAADRYDEALALVVSAQRVSTSYVQRRLAVSFNKAANLIDRLEEAGVVSTPDERGRRTVLWSPEALSEASSDAPPDGATKQVPSVHGTPEAAE